MFDVWAAALCSYRFMRRTGVLLLFLDSFLQEPASLHGWIEHALLPPDYTDLSGIFKNSSAASRVCTALQTKTTAGDSHTSRSARAGIEMTKGEGWWWGVGGRLLLLLTAWKDLSASTSSSRRWSSARLDQQADRRQKWASGTRSSGQVIPAVCRPLDCKPEGFRFKSQMQTNKLESGLVAKPWCPLEQGSNPPDAPSASPGWPPLQDYLCSLLGNSLWEWEISSLLASSSFSLSSSKYGSSGADPPTCGQCLKQIWVVQKKHTHSSISLHYYCAKIKVV